MDNIILIGMPGAGKSTLGVLLAKALNYRFMDTDLLIQDKTGKLLYETINEIGSERFIELEESVLCGVDVSRTIIATGGSAVYGDAAMEHLGKLGNIIYIKLSYDEIVRRVKNITTRGVVMKEGKTLLDVYNEREPLYDKYADIVIDCDTMGIEESVKKIVDCLGNRN